MKLNIDQIQRQWLATVAAKLIIGIVLLIGAMAIFIYVFFPDQLNDQLSIVEKQKAESVTKAASFAIIKAMLSNYL